MKSAKHIQRKQIQAKAYLRALSTERHTAQLCGFSPRVVCLEPMNLSALDITSAEGGTGALGP